MNYIKIKEGIKVAEVLYQFVNEEALPDTNVDIEQFWDGFAAIMTEFSIKNKDLLAERAQLQQQINTWHQNNKNYNQLDYMKFLTNIGYLEEETEDFQIELTNVDDEIATIAGPQLVVPINNPRYAINAANSRWGSLYDAFYGTDVIDEIDGKEKSASGYNPVRGAEVIKESKMFLDQSIPLMKGAIKML